MSKLNLKEDSKTCFVEAFEEFAIKLLDIVILDYKCYKYSSIAVASSVIAITRKIFLFTDVWTVNQEVLTFLKWHSI